MGSIDNNKLMSLIVYKLKDTLFNLMYDICESPVDDVTNPPKFLNEIMDEIKQLYSQIMDLTQKDMSGRTGFNDRIIALNKRIIDTALFVNRCTCVNNQIGVKIVKKLRNTEATEISKDLPVNNGAVLENLSHFLTHLTDDIDGCFDKADVMAVLPIRMTKARYRDYVKNGYKAIARELSPEFAKASMDRLKDMFYSDPEILKDDFPLMYDMIHEMYASLDEINTEEAANEYFSMVDDNNIMLTEIYECLGVFYNDVTYLNLISEFVVDDVLLFGDDMILKDLYYSICDCIRDNDYSLIPTILDRLNDEIEERYENSKGLESEIAKEVSEIKDISEFDEETRVSIFVNNSISRAYANDIDQQIMMGSEENRNVDELSDELCDYIENVAAYFDIPKQKSIKQDFFRSIPCTMSDNEFMDYAAYCLSGINDKDTSIMCFMDIFEITKKVEEREHGEHSHHHHGENGCCGHNHDHEHGEHDCCGHGHDHEDCNHDHGHGEHDCCGHGHNHEHEGCNHKHE